MPADTERIVRMSHFTRMKTRLVVKEHLVQALRDLGHEPRVGNVMVRGYRGQMTDTEVMIPTGNPGYDIGFRKAGETYEMVADWYGIRDIVPDAFLNSVQQRYAYRAILMRMQEQGFEVAEEEDLQDRTIHLTVRRSIF
jgi:Protein of unknown function (DUF1257)